MGGGIRMLPVSMSLIKVVTYGARDSFPRRIETAILSGPAP